MAATGDRGVGGRGSGGAPPLAEGGVGRALHYGAGGVGRHRGAAQVVLVEVVGSCRTLFGAPKRILVTGLAGSMVLY